MSRRTKGTGYLYKVGKKYKFEFKVNGKRFKRTLKATSKKEAELESDQLLSEADFKTKEEFIEKIADARGIDTSLISIDEAWNFYINSANRKNPSKETLINNERYWKKFQDWVKDQNIDAIEKVTPQLASKYMNWLLSNSSIKGQSYNKVKNFLKSFFKTLNHGTSRDNPFENITNKEIEHSGKRDLSHEELKNILDLADDDMKLLISIGAYTGLRLADATKLKWSEIDLENRSISVIPQKTKRKNKRVTIPFIHSTLFELLVAKGETPNSEYVIPEYAELYQRNRANLSRKFKRLCESAGIETEIQSEEGKNESIVGFHSLRHTFVSECAKVEIPLFIVQEIVGHGSPAITRHYTHIDKGTIKTHMKKLEAPKTALIEEKDRLSKVLELVESMTADNWQDVQQEILKYG